MNINSCINEEKLLEFKHFLNVLLTQENFTIESRSSFIRIIY